MRGQVGGRYVGGADALSITTDYAKSTGDPSPYLRRIAEAGFSHVHWCHQWNTDFIYASAEVKQIAAWFREYGLSLLDLHGSVGPEKNWTATEEYRRLAGVELVRNRLEMTADLGSDVVIMHANVPMGPDGTTPAWDSLRRSLDELAPLSAQLGVRIAIENWVEWATIRSLLDVYPPSFLGLCYDSGHGNIHGNGLDQLETTKERLLSIHLHDNSGVQDEHRLPYTGTVDWSRLVAILGASAYAKCISMESNMGREGIADEETFLGKAYAAGRRLSAMLEAACVR